MNKLRILFMGTPDFAVTILKTLIEQNYDVVGVITAPDKPAGRGRKINESAVKKYAKTQNLNILQPTNLKDKDFIAELEALKVNLNIVVAFRMLPKVVWDMPEFGTFNLHASLLPAYRGAAPIHWSIINGETKTGVSTFFIDDKIDTGEIILQAETEIEKDETVGILHDKLMHLGSDLVIKTVKKIEEGEIKTIPQPQNVPLKTAYKLNKENCKINFEESLDTVYNHIRGLNPFPAAWCELTNGEEKLDVKLYNCSKITEDHNFENGLLIIDKKSIKIALSGGYIKLDNLKLPGKRLMPIADLLNGYTFKENAKMS